MGLHTHKLSGWTRTHTGGQRWSVTPTDTSGDRIVEFRGAGCWTNNPADDVARRDDDRVVLISGDPLPDWAITWLENACRKQSEQCRAALRAALDDADWNASAREGW